MQEQASIAILSPDYDMSTLVSSVLTAQNPTRISLVHSQKSDKPSRVTSHVYIPVAPLDFVPTEIGSFIAWGANCLVLVIDSSQGIDAATINLAQQALRNHPTVIAITGLNHDRSSFDETVAVCQRVFGADRHVVATSLPVLNYEEEVQGILDLLTESIQWVGIDGLIEEHDLETEHYELIENRYDELLNALTVTTINDDFALSVLNGDAIDPETLYAEVETATIRCELIPVMPLSGQVGLAELAHLSSQVGVGTASTWTPFLHSHPTETIATILPNGLVRVWQGSLTPGEYFTVSPEGIESHATITMVGSSALQPGGQVTSVTMSPPGLPGATMSTTKTSLQIPGDLE